jgi:4-diphosphocytidyl-2-C-methyl-D-erythritol kinase
VTPSEPAPTGSLTLDAPAKLNLGLRITGRRADGYHTLESLFVPVEWCDRVTVEVRPGGGPSVVLELTGERGGAVPGDDRNLAARAARAYLEAAGASARVRVRLEKRLPAAAGLGGGSSDAGAVLRALDRLGGRAVPQGRLAELALGLGADVPYFLDPRPALVSGIGERIEPLAGLPGFWCVLANPGISLATADVYAAWDRSAAALTPTEAGSTMRSLSRLLDARDLSREPLPESLSSVSGISTLLGEILVNDLEAAAGELCPGVRDWQERLRGQGALATGMSGSGATVFGVFANETRARRAEDRLSGGGEVRRSASSGATSSTSSITSSIEGVGAWVRVARTVGSAPAA